MAGQGQDMKQGVYRTPGNFMAVVRREFSISFDLAACADNAQALDFYTKEANSLTRSWKLDLGWLWLNPPYSNIEPWARRCWEESQDGARILFLAPASVGADWYADWVHEKAEVRYLRGRLAFEFTYPLDYKDPAKAGKPNKDPYPKDLMLVVYDRDRDPYAFPWDWRASSISNTNERIPCLD